MTSDVLTVAERVDMIKLAKSVAIKSAAIIVQSRDGKTVLTKCNPNPTDHTLVSDHLIDAIGLEEYCQTKIVDNINPIDFLTLERLGGVIYDTTGKFQATGLKRPGEVIFDTTKKVIFGLENVC